MSLAWASLHTTSRNMEKNTCHIFNWPSIKSHFIIKGDYKNHLINWSTNYNFRQTSVQRNIRKCSMFIYKVFHKPMPSEIWGNHIIRYCINDDILSMTLLMIILMPPFMTVKCGIWTNQQDIKDITDKIIPVV